MSDMKILVFFMGKFPGTIQLVVIKLYFFLSLGQSQQEAGDNVGKQIIPVFYPMLFIFVSLKFSQQINKNKKWVPFLEQWKHS